METSAAPCLPSSSDGLLAAGVRVVLEVLTLDVLLQRRRAGEALPAVMAAGRAPHPRRFRGRQEILLSDLLSVCWRRRRRRCSCDCSVARGRYPGRGRGRASRRRRVGVFGRGLRRTAMGRAAGLHAQVQLPSGRHGPGEIRRPVGQAGGGPRRGGRRGHARAFGRRGGVSVRVTPSPPLPHPAGAVGAR